MSETLTYTEESSTELSADEQESLAVGEQMQQEQETLLAGKYNSPEALEKAYLELQQKLGSNEETPAESAEEPAEEPAEESTEKNQQNIFDSLWDEYSSDDGVSENLINSLKEMDTAELAEMYLQQRSQTAPSDFTDDQVESLQQVVGGSEQYGSMIEWAKSNADPNEIELFDKVMEGGDAASAYFAIRAMGQRWAESVGYEGDLIQGKAPRKSDGNKFRSQAELVTAMNDPRYESDPAYREDVIQKLGRSELNF